MRFIFILSALIIGTQINHFAYAGNTEDADVIADGNDTDPTVTALNNELHKQQNSEADPRKIAEIDGAGEGEEIDEPDGVIAGFINKFGGDNTLGPQKEYISKLFSTCGVIKTIPMNGGDKKIKSRIEIKTLKPCYSLSHRTDDPRVLTANEFSLKKPLKSEFIQQPIGPSDLNYKEAK